MIKELKNKKQKTKKKLLLTDLDHCISSWFWSSQEFPWSHLTQTKYTSDLLKIIGMIVTKRVSAYMFFRNKLSLPQGGSLEDHSLFRSTNWSSTLFNHDKDKHLIFCQSLQAPITNHWKAYKGILGYLPDMVGYSLHFKPTKDLSLSKQHR